MADGDTMSSWCGVMTKLYRRNVARRPVACDFVTNMIINTPEFDGFSIGNNAYVLGRLIVTLEALMLDPDNLERLRDNRALISRLHPYYRFAKNMDYDPRLRYRWQPWMDTDAIFQKNRLHLNHMQLETIFMKLYRFADME